MQHDGREEFPEAPHPADAVGLDNLLELAQAKSRRRRGERSERGAGGRDNLPCIRLTTDLASSVSQAVEALAADSEIYQRDGRLAKVVRVLDVEACREGMSAGTPQIREVTIPTLRERLTSVARFERYDGRSGEWADAHPPDRVVAAVDARGEWPGVRPIAGIIETPSLRPDGSVLDAPGYDAQTGYVYAPSRQFPASPESPTLDDARASLASLAEPFADFPFASPEERWVMVAALLTIVARPAIRGACPAFLADASTRGSGKSLLARVVTTLAQGREAAIMSWPPDAVELEKVLGSYALRGASVIAFDNVTGEFGSAPLDRALTCSDRVELRVLGQSKVPSLSWRAVVLAGGNNMAVGGDTTRRVLMCRLEPMMERPEERTDYAIPNLTAWCAEHHLRIVIACLTVLRAYVLAGRPSQGLAGWGSFEAWQELIASAIVWAGGADVMTCRPTLSGKDDTETGALRILLEQLRSYAPKGTSLGLMLQDLYSPERMRGQAPPDGWDALREAIETLAPPKTSGAAPNPHKLGNAFRKHRKRVVGGFYLFDCAPDTKANVKRWVVGKAGE